MEYLNNKDGNELCYISWSNLNTSKNDMKENRGIIGFYDYIIGYNDIDLVCEWLQSVKKLCSKINEFDVKKHVRFNEAKKWIF